MTALAIVNVVVCLNYRRQTVLAIVECKVGFWSCVTFLNGANIAE